MKDWLTACTGHKCPLKQNCHRFCKMEDIPAGATYFKDAPYQDGRCYCYLPIETIKETVDFVDKTAIEPYTAE